MSKNLLIHEAIKVETAMINQVRFWDYFLSQDRKSLIIHPLTKERYHSSKALGYHVPTRKQKHFKTVSHNRPLSLVTYLHKEGPPNH